MEDFVKTEKAPVTYRPIEGDCFCQPTVLELNIYLDGIAIGKFNFLSGDNPNNSHTRITPNDFYTGDIHRYPLLYFFVTNYGEITKLGRPQNIKNIQQRRAKNIRPRHSHYLGI
ncbi:hypothetical protein ES703_62587 [subsurface metagenome]